ncbi:MAG: hypothetical protein B7Z30_03195, partial [Rhizobiales bacterium 12-68-15]
MAAGVSPVLSRRAVLGVAAGALLSTPVLAQSSSASFPAWVAKFKARARARGIDDSVYDAVMRQVVPDTSVYAADKAQPEFQEEV